MPKLEEIKQAINRLDPGTFQVVCDQYLYREGYKGIIESLGTEAGTTKTTRGTPDTYFTLSDGKYIFVEYTTQKQNLAKKIEQDIDKCLDEKETNIENKNITKIIYCHTSSNLEPGKTKGVYDKCRSEHIELQIIGIDELASALYDRHPRIIRDYLNIKIDTEQIQTIDDFLHQHDANQLSAPLKVDFLFREEVVKKLEEKFKQCNVVIVKGAPGIGKTRLALYFAEEHTKNNNERLFCIRDNGQSIFDDLKIYLSKPGKYFLVVDDANQVSGLKNIIQYAAGVYPGKQVKVLITVRDYAKKSVEEKLLNNVKFDELELKSFKNEEIEQILRKNLKINFEEAIDRIVDLAKGNARIAMLAGKVFREKGEIQSIFDVSDLYSRYYEPVLSQIMESENRRLIICAGIIAFFQKMYLDETRMMHYQKMLKVANITQGEFIHSVNQLHELEIVDVYSTWAVKFSDQCLRDYLLYYLLYKTEMLSLGDLIFECFFEYQKQILYLLNTVLKLDQSPKVLEKTTNIINEGWKRLETADEGKIECYLESFYQFLPIPALLWCKEKVDGMEAVEFDKKVLLHESYDDEIQDLILEMICGLAETKEAESATELFFKYYQKRTDLFNRFVKAFKENFNITEYSAHDNYLIQRYFLKHLKKYSDNWKNDGIVYFFYRVAQEYLKYTFENTVYKREHTFSYYEFELDLDESVREFRETVWNYLLELCASEKRKIEVLKVLITYGHGAKKENDLYQMDTPFLKNILEKCSVSEPLETGIIANRLLTIWNMNGWENDSFCEYLNAPEYQLYNRFQGGYGERANAEYWLKEEQFEEIWRVFAEKCTLEEFRSVLNIIKRLEQNQFVQIEALCRALLTIFDSISPDDERYLGFVNEYLSLSAPGKISPRNIINKLFKVYPAEQILNLIEGYAFSSKNNWKFDYYRELPPELVNEDVTNQMISFLVSDLRSGLVASDRDLVFLDKYQIEKENIYIIISTKFYDLFDENPRMVCEYLFNTFRKKEDELEFILSFFSNDIKKLESFYVKSISVEGTMHFDYGGRILRGILEKDVQFASEYIEAVLKRKYADIQYQVHRIETLVNSENSIEAYDVILTRLFDTSFFESRRERIAEIIITGRDRNHIMGEQEMLIKKYIERHSEDAQLMRRLFLILARTKDERRISYYLELIKRNSSSKMFAQIPLTPNLYSYTGSIVSIYNEEIDFLNELKSQLSGLDWIEHRKIIQDKIEERKIRIHEAELEDFMGY